MTAYFAKPIAALGIIMLLAACVSSPQPKGDLAAPNGPTDNQLRSGDAFIEEIPTDPRGGYAFRLTYVVEGSVDAVWRFVSDLDSDLITTRRDVIEQRVIQKSGNVVVTEGVYDFLVDLKIRSKHTLSPAERRIDVTVTNPEAFMQAFNYGRIELYPFGNATKVVRTYYFKGVTTALWVMDPGPKGMRAHYKEIARWDAATFLTWAELRKTAPAPVVAASPASPRPSEMPAARQGKKFAVVVGISRYQDERVPSLNYAAKDAETFHQWLVSPAGGFPEANVKLLLDEDATLTNIKEALFDWLKQTIDEDLVTIYFAGHGSPESPDFPDNLFLLPHDTDYDRIATTAFPMWDVETALKRFVRAKRVVVIADACHSGGVGKDYDVARRGITVNPISRGLQSLSEASAGVAVISAARENQFSQEGEQWGGGHGVFTFFLLKGLTGDADANSDDRVSLGELIPFLSENVRRATRNGQSPTIAGQFDPALVLGM